MLNSCKGSESLYQKPIQSDPKILPKMVQNRGLEGVWGCFAACLRPKAPRGRFQDASGAALGRFLAHLGRLLGGSWDLLGTKPGRPRAS